MHGLFVLNLNFDRGHVPVSFLSFASQLLTSSARFRNMQQVHSENLEDRSTNEPCVVGNSMGHWAGLDDRFSECFIHLIHFYSTLMIEGMLHDVTRYYQRCRPKPSKTIKNHQKRSTKTIKSHQKPSKAIKNHQKPSRTIKSHQKPSKTIKNHQKPLKTAIGTETMQTA